MITFPPWLCIHCDCCFLNDNKLVKLPALSLFEKVLSFPMYYSFVNFHETASHDTLKGSYTTGTSTPSTPYFNQMNNNINFHITNVCFAKPFKV